MTPLQKAAQAVLKDWDSPDYLEDSIEQLRKALVDEITQAVEPVGVVDEGDDGLFVDLETSKGVVVKRGDKLFTHPPQPQATTPVLHECWYESSELKVCRKCGQLHDKAIAAQGEKP